MICFALALNHRSPRGGAQNRQGSGLSALHGPAKHRWGPGPNQEAATAMQLVSCCKTNVCPMPQTIPLTPIVTPLDSSAGDDERLDVLTEIGAQLGFDHAGEVSLIVELVSPKHGGECMRDMGFSRRLQDAAELEVEGFHFPQAQLNTLIHFMRRTFQKPTCSFTS